MAPLLAALALAAAPIHVHYGRSAEQTLDAYVAPGARRAVILIHGGGWRAGSKESLDPTAPATPFVAVMPPAGPSGHYDGEWAGPWERYLVRRVLPWTQAHLAVWAFAPRIAA